MYNSCPYGTRDAPQLALAFYSSQFSRLPDPRASLRHGLRRGPRCDGDRARCGLSTLSTVVWGLGCAGVWLWLCGGPCACTACTTIPDTLLITREVQCSKRPKLF